MFFNSLPSMLIGAVAVLITITIHELAHGYVAYALGDETAKSAGRLSLNPIAHLDPLGAILLFVVGFGWAKPVPVNPFYFRGNRTRGIMLVSIAGPLANLLLAFILAAGVIPLLYYLHLASGQAISIITSACYLNIYMAIFNLLPVPPLDGSKILAGFLPKNVAYKYLSTMERYGMLILLLLVVTNVISKIVVPLASGVYNAFIMVALMFIM